MHFWLNHVSVVSKGRILDVVVVHCTRCVNANACSEFQLGFDLVRNLNQYGFPIAFTLENIYICVDLDHVTLSDSNLHEMD